jgi:putative heme-binding domain-containing protein
MPVFSQRARRAAALSSLALLLLSLPAAAQTFTQDHPGQYTQSDIATGYDVYRTQCAYCHGPFGDQVSGIDLRRRVFKRSSTDEDLARVITLGIPGTGMPPNPLKAPELAGVVAYVRAGFDQTMDVTVGDAARGRSIFEGKGECGNCHRVRGRGPRSAPDLSDIGLARSPAALRRTLIDPSSAMLPINRPVRIVTRDGRTIHGRRLNEDTYTVQVLNDDEKLLSITKSDIKTFVVETTSPMPSYKTKLTADEIADVLAYLITLREP